jgi:hypothetical protein
VFAKGLFPSGFPIRLLTIPMRAICPTHVFFIYLINL